MKASNLIPVERIERAIYVIRTEKVMLDRELRPSGAFHFSFGPGMHMTVA